MTAAFAPPGFFGKLPSRGDFVSRRLPAEFVAAWDGWLQDAIAASRAELGGGWLDVYLTSPIWRFALAPGVCGPRGCLGVMIPSVDRVGRYFPLAVAADIEEPCSPLALAIGLEEWFDAVEVLMLATLADAPLELEAFDARLERMVPDAPCPDLDMPRGAATLRHWRFADGRFVDALAMLGAGALADRDARSVWWSQGSERIEPCVLLAPALPEPGAFAAMLDGGWPARGWRDGALPALERGKRTAAASVPGLRAASVSDPGKVRDVNEDACACREDLGIWLVADGLGGHQAGEVASRMVVSALDGVTADTHGAERVEQIVRGLRVANRCLRVLAERDAKIGLAASTVAALLLDGGSAWCVWAGDSRIYRLRDGRLEQLSADHVEPNGGLESRAVTRAVGSPAALELEITRSDALDGDCFLLCTDGVYAEIDTAAIAAALSLPTPEHACASLRDAVLAGAARDNLTAVVVHVGTPAARSET